MDPFRFFFRRAGPRGAPPSAYDSAGHALDFSARYAEDIDLAVSQRMLDLGIEPERIGMSNDPRGIRHAAFHSEGTEGGNVSPDGRMIVDSGLFHLDLLKPHYGRRAGALYQGSRIGDRSDAILAHEYEEHRRGMSHADALEHAPHTWLPISGRAREICRAMRRGWGGR